MPNKKVELTHLEKKERNRLNFKAKKEQNRMYDVMM